MFIEILSAVGGLGLICLVTYTISTNRKLVIARLPRIFFLFIIQFILGFILLRTRVGVNIIGWFDQGFSHLLEFAQAGTNFVFSPLNHAPEQAGHSQIAFIFAVLMPIIFMSGIIGILQWLRILPLLIRVVGSVLAKISGAGKLQSYYSLASLILGQELVPVSIKKCANAITHKRLYSLGIVSMSTASLSILGSYTQIIGASYVITAIVLNLIGTFIITSLVNPLPTNEDDLAVTSESERKSFFENLSEYLLDGGRIAAIVAVMLIGYTALLALLNSVCFSIFGITFQNILGKALSPLAFFAGVDMHHAVQVGTYMGTKIISNEFVAMNELSKDIKAQPLGAHSQAIISTFLVSFANFSSIGITSGAFRAIDEEKGKHLAKIGLKCLFGACLTSYLTCIVVGLLTL